MRHIIQTSAELTAGNRDDLDEALAPFNYAITALPRADQPRNLYVLVEGNGALLRDVVDTLDRAGLLG